MRQIISGNTGYPRIGKQREWKKSIEAYWAGKITEAQLHEQLTAIRLDNLRLQRDKGIDVIPVGDFTYYDHVLDTATMFGLIPERFGWEGGNSVPLKTYYAIARGNDTATASEMTKWFNTNYHYIVPELRDLEPRLTINRPLTAYLEAKEQLGIEGRPVLLGLFTFLKLSKGFTNAEWGSWIAKLLPLYVNVLQDLKAAGAVWVQIDEPAAVISLTGEELSNLRQIYETIAEQVPGLSVMLNTFFESVANYEEFVSLPVDGVGLDLVHGKERNLEALRSYGFPQGKTLGAGLIDGRNIWRADLDEARQLLEDILKLAGNPAVIIQPSCSLLHVPVNASAEAKLDPVLREALSFAEQKLDEVIALSQAASSDVSPELFANNRAALRSLAEAPARNRDHVRKAVDKAIAEFPHRNSEFGERRGKQEAKWQLPFLPTTTIGSFPQTAEVRAARQKWRKKEWTEEQYDEFIRAEISKWIQIQEEIGLDVLVHGEFERTDMVEFFGEKLPGFAFTQGGWVQSYGSRCVKPPVIYGDVELDQPMTVKETTFAQSLTDKPVKGMLTGPITILNWSFVRSDLSREQVAYQIALALRKEIEALEQAGIEMIQVDEPAMREGLPLKREDWARYLEWTVKAFRISTSTVRDTTQIHTHMCYSEFDDIINEIEALDADVISIETSRSHGELVHTFEKHDYPLGIGLGVYDIHSPRIPSDLEMISMIERALQVLDPKLFWINPDCGLKTRGQEETVASLKQMVSAADYFRKVYRQAEHENNL